MSLVGDGASLYSPQALWTAAREKLPVTFVVMNNREYNVLKNFMKAQPHFLSIRTNRFIRHGPRRPAHRFPGARHFDGHPIAADRTGAGTSRVPWKRVSPSGVPNLIEIPIAANLSPRAVSAIEAKP